MSASIDATSSARGATNVDLNFTHTPVGTPSGVFVIVSLDATAGATTVSYGGNAMTQDQTLNNGVANGCQLWELPSPPAGPQTVIVHDSTNNSAVHFGAVVVTVAGGSTVSVFDSTAQGSGSGATASLSFSVPSGRLGVGFYSVANNNFGTPANNDGATAVAMFDYFSGSPNTRWAGVDTKVGSSSSFGWASNGTPGTIALMAGLLSEIPAPPASYPMRSDNYF